MTVSLALGYIIYDHLFEFQAWKKNLILIYVFSLR